VAEELIDICDDNMTPIGSDTRSEAHKRGLWHVAVHCWLVRPDPPGHVLFAKRSAGWVTGGGLFDVTAIGHPESGETVDERVAELVKALGLGSGEAALVRLGVKIEVNRLGNDIVIREFCPTYFATTRRRAHEYDLDHDVLTGMVEIAIPDGLELFSGRAPRSDARGVEYDVEAADWKRVEREVGTPQFLSRVDPYYYKVFIMAGRMLEGARDLAV
jgi:isopentenyldiphosphate isomerase